MGEGEQEPSSHTRDLSMMRQLNKEFETKNIQEITTWQIEKYKARRKEEVKPATVNREVALLKHMYTKAIEWGKAKESPAKKVKLLKGEVNRVRFLMPEEIRALLSNCAGHLKPIVTVAPEYRHEEGRALEPEMESGQPGLGDHLSSGYQEPREARYSHQRDGQIGSQGVEGGETWGFVFCNGLGQNFGSLRHSFETALRKSGSEDFRFHDLRHTFASNLVMEGVDLVTVQQLMGHKTLEMTLRYSHLAPNHKIRAVNIPDRILSLNPPQGERPAKVIPLST